MKYTLITDLLSSGSVPPDSILSRTLHGDDRVKVVHFRFAEGQELSAHTAPMPAILYILEGDAILKLGDDEHRVSVGSFVHMEAKLPHAIKALTNLTMLLVMLKNPVD